MTRPIVVATLISMSKLGIEKRPAILAALVEHCSINATARMCGVSKLTVLRLLTAVCYS